MRYLFQDKKGLRGNELLKRFPKYSKAMIYRHAKRPIDEVTTFDKRKHNKGRPRKLSIREERNIMRHLRICRTTVGSFFRTQTLSDGRCHSDLCFPVKSVPPRINAPYNTRNLVPIAYRRWRLCRITFYTLNFRKFKTSTLKVRP